MKKATLKQVHQLRQTITECNPSAVATVLRFFDKAEFSAQSLIGYHDALLFLAAYPPSAELYNTALTRLNNFDKSVKTLIRKRKSNADLLVNSGINGTEVQGAFTLPFLREVVTASPANIDLHSFGEMDGDAGEILKPYVLNTESDLCESQYTIEELAEKLFGRKNHLHKLVQLFSTAKVSEAIRENHFSKLSVFATLKLNSSYSGRTSSILECGSPFIHSEFIRKSEPSVFVNTPISAPKEMSLNAKAAVRQTAMRMLASLSRETDPITLSDDSAVEYFELERGVSVALFSMRAERRMPLDSYIGYMLFKNGVPLAYGGAWIFGNRALFGINIFEPFRGGESNLIILQLLRVYRQHYGIDSFSVEPYQYGKDNPEGIASGAYWFYYKLGFRSDDKLLSKLADSEMKRMKASKEYRSSSKVLQRFTASNITWIINPAVKIAPDPSSIAASITKNVLKNSDGDRNSHIVALRKKSGTINGISDTMLLLLEALKVKEESAGSVALKLSGLKNTSERKYNHELKKWLF
jgi:hypothetical protein